MKFQNTPFLFLVCFVMVNCSDEELSPPPRFSYTQNFDIDHGALNTQSYFEGADAHSGKKFSRADVGTNFGFGYSLSLPDSLNGKTVLVDVDGWVRTGDLANNCELIVSATTNDSLMLWMGCGIKEIMKTPNEWSNIKHTVVLAPNLTSKPNIYITILAHNIDAKSFFDVDDLKVTYSEQEQVN